MALVETVPEPGRRYTHSVVKVFVERMGKRVSLPLECFDPDTLNPISEKFNNHPVITEHEVSVQELMWSIDRFTVNPFLTEELWFRHDLSLKDILEMLEASSRQELWKLARLFHFEVTASAIKPCNASTDLVEITGKTVILDKLTALIKQKYADREKLPRRCLCISDCVPRLPVHLLTNDQMQEVIETCCGTQSRPWLEHSVKKRQVSHPYIWKGLMVVPYKMIRKVIWDPAGSKSQKSVMLLQMAVLLPWDDYRAIYGTPPCVWSTPFSFHIQSDPETRFVAVKETFYFYAENIEQMLEQQ